MKLNNLLLGILILSIFLVGCQESRKAGAETETQPQEVSGTELVEHLSVDIKGMTCEIGCARLIQSKLYKADGVKYAKISFADSSGIVSFDSNRISQDRIKEIIENSGGGDIYTVVAMEQTKAPQLESTIQ